jgi:hypothetical protein
MKSRTLGPQSCVRDDTILGVVLQDSTVWTHARGKQSLAHTNEGVRLFWAM